MILTCPDSSRNICAKLFEILTIDNAKNDISNRLTIAKSPFFEAFTTASTLPIRICVRIATEIAPRRRENVFATDFLTQSGSCGICQAALRAESVLLALSRHRSAAIRRRSMLASTDFISMTCKAEAELITRTGRAAAYVCRRGDPIGPYAL